MTSRQTIIRKIQASLLVNTITPMPSPVINREEEVWSDNPKQDLRLLFAEQFTNVGGNFIYIDNSSEVVNALNTLFAKWGEKVIVYCPYTPIKESLSTIANIEWSDKVQNADVAITNCMYMVARTGSIAISEQQGTMDSIGAPIHIVLASDSQLVFDMTEVLTPDNINNNPSLSFITGPSRTADIEKTLIIGVHGTKELYLLFVKQPI